MWPISGFQVHVAKKRDVTFHYDDVSKSRARVLGEWKTLSQETLILEHVFSTLLYCHTFPLTHKENLFDNQDLFYGWQGDYFL